MILALLLLLLLFKVFQRVPLTEKLRLLLDFYFLDEIPNIIFVLKCMTLSLQTRGIARVLYVRQRSIGNKGEGRQRAYL